MIDRTPADTVHVESTQEGKIESAESNLKFIPVNTLLAEDELDVVKYFSKVKKFNNTQEALRELILVGLDHFIEEMDRRSGKPGTAAPSVPAEQADTTGTTVPPAQTEPAPSEPTQKTEPAWWRDAVWKRDASGQPVTDGSGVPLMEPIPQNIRRILEQHPDWAGRFRFEMVSQKVTCRGLSDNPGVIIAKIVDWFRVQPWAAEFVVLTHPDIWPSVSKTAHRTAYRDLKADAWTDGIRNCCDQTPLTFEDWLIEHAGSKRADVREVAAQMRTDPSWPTGQHLDVIREHLERIGSRALPDVKGVWSLWVSKLADGLCGRKDCD